MPVDRAESGSSRRRSSIRSAKSKRTSPNEIHDGKFVRHHPNDLTSKEKHKSFSTAMALERAGATEKKLLHQENLYLTITSQPAVSIATTT